MLSSFVLTACSKSENQSSSTASTPEVSTPTATTSASESTEVNALPISDTAETSLDWAGEYKGVFPCADCEGIKMELELKNDKTYTLKSEYLGEKKENKFEDKGTFEFKEGNFIVLKDAKDPKEEKVFFVTEGSVFMAEKVADNSAKKEYKLTKK